MTLHRDQTLDDAAWLHRLARALVRDPHLAEDLAQDSLVVGLEAPAPAGRAWLSGVAQRLARAHRRGRLLRTAKEAARARREASDVEQRTVEQLELHRRLTEAVMALAEPYRSTIKLRFFDGLSPAQIAAQRGVSAAAVRQQVHRGLGMLRTQLDREFGSRGAWLAGCLALRGGVGSLSLILGAWSMKKIATAAAAILVAGLWWLSPASDTAGEDGASPNPPAELVVAPQRSDAASVTVSTHALAERQEQSFAVRVRTADGRAAAATVHCWRTADRTIEQRTDPDGVARFPASDSPGGVAVFAPGQWPLVTALPALREPHDVVLAPGLLLAGTLSIDGQLAPAGLELGLQGTIELPDSAPDDIRALFRFATYPATTATDARGEFRFAGLASHWRGTLTLPKHLWAVRGAPGTAQENQLNDLTPTPHLAVSATELPQVRGRVVWEDDDAPVADASVMLVARFVDTSIDTPSTGATGGRDGRFVVPLIPSSSSWHDRWRDPAQRPAVASVEVLATSATALRSVTASFTAAQLAAAEPVVRLRHAPVRHFLARDPRGLPVAGARIGGELAGPTEISTPTGQDGRGTFVARDGAQHLGAPGYAVAPAVALHPAAGTADDPLVFELQPDSQLVVRLRDPKGAPAACASVDVITGQKPLRGNRWPYSLDEAFGASTVHYGGKLGDDRQVVCAELTWTPDVSGTLVLRSLVPGLGLRVVARDRLRRELAAQELTAPPLGETTNIDLTLPPTPAPIVGRVRAHDGAPLARARVTLRLVAAEDGIRDCRVATDASGSFAIRHVHGDGPFELVAEASGHTPMAHRVDHARSRVEFVLHRGREVIVHLRDPAGAPVDVAVAVTPRPGDQGRAQRLAPGSWRFPNLPTGTVVFSASLGATKFTLDHDTRFPEAELRVPQPGRVQVRRPAQVPEREPGVGHYAQITRLDVVEPATRVNFASPTALAPGRYRAVLVRVEHRSGERVPVEQGMSAEFEVRGGEELEVELR